jgi:predicted SAM-dependent methyltransferase
MVTIKSSLRPLKAIFQRIWWANKRKIFSPPIAPDGKIFLHLGCGSINAAGYVNVDIRPFSHIHYVHEAYPLEIFKSNQFDLVYASHLLEHYSVQEAPNVLKEWHRVLKKGGILRLGVPDFTTIIEIYKDTNEIKEIQGPLMGGQTDKYNFHKSIYDEEYLKRILRDIGFNEVRTWDPELVEHHEFTDTTSKKCQIGNKIYAISLNLEAVK